MAALMVVAFHVVGMPFVVGAAGVDVFFVISGFVIGLITAAGPVAPMAFAYDRATRILPLYWLFTSVVVALMLAAPSLVPRLPLDLGWIAASYLLVPVLKPDTGGTFPVLYQGWTLWYEALFYVLAVIAIVFAPRRQALALTGMILLLVAAGLLFWPEAVIGQTYTDPLLIEFLVGYWFARWRSVGGVLALALGRALLAAGAIGLAVAGVYAGSPEGWPRLLAWGLPAMAITVGAVTIEDHGRLGEWRAPVLLGDASYAIYLSHGLVVSVMVTALRLAGMPLLDPLRQPLESLLIFTLATVAGVAVHLAVERPLMAWFRRARSVLFAQYEPVKVRV